VVEGECVHPFPWACGGIHQVVGLLSAGGFRLLLAQVSLDMTAVPTAFRLAGAHVPTQVTTFMLLVTFLVKHLWL